MNLAVVMNVLLRHIVKGTGLSSLVVRTNPCNRSRIVGGPYDDIRYLADHGILASQLDVAST